MVIKIEIYELFKAFNMQRDVLNLYMKNITMKQALQRVICKICIKNNKVEFSNVLDN